MWLVSYSIFMFYTWPSCTILSPLLLSDCIWIFNTLNNLLVTLTQNSLTLNTALAHLKHFLHFFSMLWEAGVGKGHSTSLHWLYRKSTSMPGYMFYLNIYIVHQASQHYELLYALFISQGTINCSPTVVSDHPTVPRVALPH